MDDKFQDPIVLEIQRARLLQSICAEYNQRYEIHLNRAFRIKSRYQITPSIRPVYGRLLSRFGMRRHPVLVKRRMHKGIDIATWPGAPIQSAADGVVNYAGWSNSFGYLVVIDHGQGYRTKYAHCSKLLVSKREVVKKGQVIAQVGSTGISSGPHLHYEVIKWGRALNPLPFLDVDMFTARRRLW